MTELLTIIIVMIENFSRSGLITLVMQVKESPYYIQYNYRSCCLTDLTQANTINCI